MVPRSDDLFVLVLPNTQRRAYLETLLNSALSETPLPPYRRVRLDGQRMYWTAAICRDGECRYQLTCIGGFAPVYVAEKISGGRFRIAKLPPGEYSVEVRAAGCLPYRVKEKLAPGVRLKVEYFVERRSYDPYETVVTVKAVRKEVSRYTVALPEMNSSPSWPAAYSARGKCRSMCQEQGNALSVQSC